MMRIHRAKGGLEGGLKRGSSVRQGSAETSSSAQASVFILGQIASKRCASLQVEPDKTVCKVCSILYSQKQQHMRKSKGNG